MTTDCSFHWPDIGRITGPCIRPGGIALTNRALDACGLPPGARVADIGCGAGGTLGHLERAGLFRPVGLDCSETLLRVALAGLAPGRLVRGLAETLPFKSGSFDALFCECVLSVVDERAAALGEFGRVLKNDGFLVMSDVFASDNPGRPQHGPGAEPDLNGLLGRDDLLGLLAGYGFSTVLWEEHKRLLKEFAARMILAGACLPAQWRRARGISYFLLVARKSSSAARRRKTWMA
jgi:SAM-dependent methyltransferase